MNKTQTFFLIAIGFNVFYLVLTFIFFYFLDSSLMNIGDNDYLSYHNAGLNVLEDLPNLYDSPLSPFPFRYFPLSAYFFTPFSLLGLKLGYFVFQIFNFFLNFVIIYLIYKIIQIHKNLNINTKINYELCNLREIFSKSENESILHQSALLLIMPLQFMNYFLGQVNLLTSVFILASLFYFLKERRSYDYLGGLLLGFGILVKPTLILILPFIIALSYNRETRKFTFKFKQTIIRLSGSIILIVISGFFFLIYPKMLDDFIKVNLTGKHTYSIGGDVEVNPSISLTRIVLIFFELLDLNINNFLVFIVVSLLILLPIYFLFILSADQPNKIIIGYLIAVTTASIVYFDTWPHHLVVLASFMIIFMLLYKNFERFTFFKYIHNLLAILTAMLWVIFFLTYEIFPFNLGGLVLLILLYYNLFIFCKHRI